MPVAEAASWRARAKAAGVNAAVMVASAALFLLIFELLIFRYIVVASDVPRNVWMGDMIRLHRGDQGVMRIGGEISASFEVNAQGWNTGHGDYYGEREACPERVAIVGDSFVEALQVDHDSSVAEVLSRESGAEVFRFGIGGAPLSHYLLVTEHEAMSYSPDWVVIVIVHNDFDESFLFQTGRYGSSFAKLQVVDGEIVGDIEAVPYHPGWVDHVRQFANVRYLFYNLNLRSAYWNFRPIHSLLYGQRDVDPEFEANVDTNVIAARWLEIEAVTDYFVRRARQDRAWPRCPAAAGHGRPQAGHLRRQGFDDVHRRGAQSAGG
jgi:hypothetical protein